jgi:opacity protein-like surface antigen
VYQNVGGRLTYNIGRGLGARVGYGYGESISKGGRAGVPLHNLDLGVDFNRSLSFSRRTTLSFSTGSSAVTVDGDTQFGLIGSAALVREIGRTWSASLQYGRTVQIVETWQQPLFVDGLSVEFGGLMTRRLQFYSSVRGSLGHVGLGTSDNRVETYSGAAGLGYAFNRSLKVSADYLYYRYDMGRAAAVLPQAFSQLNQQSARVTLSVWAPILTRTRRGDASR